MTVTINGLIPGHLTVLEVAHLLEQTYCQGGRNENWIQIHFTSVENMFNITFNENWSPDERMLPLFQRPRRRHRNMSVHVNGSCKGDYKDTTTKPHTLVTLGASGDALEIITAMVRPTGGYVKDESKEDEYYRIRKPRLAA